jgi:hypothetical protein
MTTGENNENAAQMGGHYASRGTANTALGLGIAGTALGLGAMGLFGARPNGGKAGPGGPDSPYVGVREFYQYALGEADKRFNDYKDIRNMNDFINHRISELNAKIDVLGATTPLMFQNEAIKRGADDRTIVGYVNGTFMPLEVADVTIGTTATPRTPYNPLAPSF